MRQLIIIYNEHIYNVIKKERQYITSNMRGKKKRNMNIKKYIYDSLRYLYYLKMINGKNFLKIHFDNHIYKFNILFLFLCIECDNY